MSAAVEGGTVVQVVVDVTRRETIHMAVHVPGGQAWALSRVAQDVQETLAGKAGEIITVHSVRLDMESTV